MKLAETTVIPDDLVRYFFDKFENTPSDKQVHLRSVSLFICMFITYIKGCFRRV